MLNRIGERMRSRLQEMYVVVEMTGEDFRAVVQLVPAPLDVHVAAAEQNIDRLADAIQQIVRRRVDRPDAVQFALDEERAFAVQRLGIVALALLLRAARDGRARLQNVKTRGAGLFGHQGPSSQSTPEVRRVAPPK